MDMPNPIKGQEVSGFRLTKRQGLVVKPWGWQGSCSIPGAFPFPVT